MKLFVDLESKHHLSITDRAKIEALRKTGMSYRKIAASLNVTHTQVSRFFTSKSFTGKIERRERKRIFTKRNIRSLKTLATRNLMTATNMKATLGLGASISTIQRSLKRDLSLTYAQIPSKPILTKLHKQKRVAWVRKQFFLCELEQSDSFL